MWNNVIDHLTNGSSKLLEFATRQDLLSFCRSHKFAYSSYFQYLTDPIKINKWDEAKTLEKEHHSLADSAKRTGLNPFGRVTQVDLNMAPAEMNYWPSERKGRLFSQQPHEFAMLSAVRTLHISEDALDSIAELLFSREREEEIALENCYDLLPMEDALLTTGRDFYNGSVTYTCLKLTDPGPQDRQIVDWPELSVKVSGQPASEREFEWPTRLTISGKLIWLPSLISEDPNVEVHGQTASRESSPSPR